MSGRDSIQDLCGALAAAGVAFRRGVPMRDHTTWRIGGPADVLVVPESRAQLLAGLHAARQAGVPIVVMGRGSNLLFADEGVRGAVFQVGPKMAGIQVEGCRLGAEAGALVCRVALMACRRELAGLEHVVGIPGTMGGLVAMNGGSRQLAIGDVLEWVDACGCDGTIRRFDREDCRFAYRDSRFLRESAWTILQCSLRLVPGARATIRGEMLEILRERRRKFHRKEPSCGSVFKSAPELYARVGPPGKIIEDCGFKGLRSGSAEVSPHHANFIVNAGCARAVDVLALVHAIRQAVHARYGVWLETEARYVFPRGETVPVHEVA